MHLLDTAKTVLHCGALIAIHYNDGGDVIKRTTVCSRSLAAAVGICNKIKGEYIDIILEEEFVFDKNIVGIEYIGVPAGLTLSDLTEKTTINQQFGSQFLLNDTEYLHKIKECFDSERSNYINFYLSQIEPYNTGTASIVTDLYFLRFYPKIPSNQTKEELIKEVEEDVKVKYKILQEDAQPVMRVINMFGLSNKAFANTDPEFIAAVKRLWFNLMTTEANKYLQLLGNQQARFELDLAHYDAVPYTRAISQTDLMHYIYQIKEIKELVLTLAPSMLDKCSTVRDIFSTWPGFLQPQPVYIDEY
jgi:hypothetical protein